ncbi:patatin-like phospholipase family protein [Candidatus Margulisiibacteriota bacterium]
MKNLFAALTATLIIILFIAAAPGADAKVFELEYQTEKYASFPSPFSPFDKNMPKIGIAFSGGGPVRGIAHVGVVQFLEKKGFKSDYAAGTSMGSIIGSLYALGYTGEEMERSIAHMNWMKIVTGSPKRQHTMLQDYEQNNKYLLTMNFSEYYDLEAPIGLVQGHYVLAAMNKIAYRGATTRDYDDFNVPFRLNMVNLETGKEKIVREGYLVEDLRASSSLPIFFDPFWINGEMYVDGGLASNMQCDVVKNMGADIVIGVHIPEPKMKKEQIESLFNVISQTITFNSDKRLKENMLLADLLIEPDVSKLDYFNFTQIGMSIDEGRKAAERSYPQLVKLLKERSTLKPEYHEISHIVIPSHELISKQDIKLKAPGKISDEQIYAELKRIYRSGNFKAVSAELKGGELTVKLKENSRINSVNVKNASVFNSRTLRNLIELKDGEILNTEKVDRGIKDILRRYHKNGYLLTKIKEVNVEGDALNIVLDEGKTADFMIMGVESVPHYYIYEKFRDLKGKVFNHNDVQDRLNAIYAQGYFNYIYYRVDNAENGKLITLVANEKETNSISMGFSYDTDSSLRLLLGLNMISLSGHKWQVSNQIMLAKNPQATLTVGFFPNPLFSYLSVEGDLFWNRISTYLDSGAVKTPQEVAYYGATIKGDVHFTPWDNTSLGLISRKLDYTSYPTTGATSALRRSGGAFMESRIDFTDKNIFPYFEWGMLYKINKFNDQEEDFINTDMSVDIGKVHTFTIGKTAGRVDQFYSYDRNFLLGGMGSLAGWKTESILAQGFDITHYMYSLRMYTNPNNILQNAYLNIFLDEGVFRGAMNLDKSAYDVTGDMNLSGWGIGIAGESILNLHTVINYEFSKENLARMYFKIGNNF